MGRCKSSPETRHAPPAVRQERALNRSKSGVGGNFQTLLDSPEHSDGERGKGREEEGGDLLRCSARVSISNSGLAAPQPSLIFPQTPESRVVVGKR